LLTSIDPCAYMSDVEMSTPELWTSEPYAHGSDHPRSPPGHPRPPGPQDSLVGPGARVRHRPLDPTADRRRIQARSGLALSGALPARGARLDRERMAAVRHEPP